MKRGKGVVDSSIEITDENREILTTLIVGRTIASFTRGSDTGEDWPTGENSVTIVLDDGSELMFDSWGYDAWGTLSYFTPSGDAASTILTTINELREANASLTKELRTVQNVADSLNGQLIAAREGKHSTFNPSVPIHNDRSDP